MVDSEDDPGITDPARRNEWARCLYGDDQSSLGSQVYALQRDFVDWWTINEARRFAPRDAYGATCGFAMLHRLLDRSFAVRLMVAIRRICDASYPLEGRRGVWSLASLLDDMRKHSTTFTETRLRETGITSDTAKAVFKGLRDRLRENCEATCAKVDKYLAHAATPGSRRDVTPNSTLAELREAVETVTRIFRFVKVLIPAPATPPGVVLPRGQNTVFCVELESPLDGIAQPLVALPADVQKIESARKAFKMELLQNTDPSVLLRDIATNSPCAGTT